MPVALRRYVTAGLAVTFAGVIAVNPTVTQHLPEKPATAAAVRLTGDGSLLNVPLNLFQALVNIPYNEVKALEVMAQSLLITGPWFVGSPTNVWGEDPGDPGHFQSLIDMFIPFPELSGMGHEGDYNYPGLGEQIAMLAAAEIPADPSCQSFACIPMVPTSPITGLTWVDQLLWTGLVGTLVQKLPVLDNWFQVPFSAMTGPDGYTFNVVVQDAQGNWQINPGLVDSGPVATQSGYTFLWPGTHAPTAEDIAEAAKHGLEFAPGTQLMPWAGETFHWDVGAPFQNFFNSLMAPVDPQQYLDGFHLVDPTEFLRALQAVTAGSFLDFNPFVYGSPLCPGPCTLPDGSQTYEGFIKVISAMWPGNKYLDQWMSMNAANDNQLGFKSPQAETIADYLTWLWRNQTSFFDFNNGKPGPEGNQFPSTPVPPGSGAGGSYGDVPTAPGGAPTGSVINTDYLPTLDQVNGWITAHLGAGTTALLNNIGILGPFDLNWVLGEQNVGPDLSDVFRSLGVVANGEGDYVFSYPGLEDALGSLLASA